jgi:hypothetical protein
MKILIDNDLVIASSEVIEFGFYEGENKYKINEGDKLFYIGIPVDRCKILEVTTLPEDFVSYKYKYVKDEFVLDENWEEPKPFEIEE